METAPGSAANAAGVSISSGAAASMAASAAAADEDDDCCIVSSFCPSKPAVFAIPDHVSRWRSPVGPAQLASSYIPGVELEAEMLAKHASPFSLADES